MAAKPLPSAEALRQLFTYDPLTGIIRHKDGNVAFTYVHNGYLRGVVEGRKVMAHRVAWKIVTGEDADLIDHRNGRRADNRWRNLRDASPVINGRNMARSRLNTSGVTGVSFHRRMGKWRADIRVDGKLVYLGLFSEITSAITARRLAEQRYGFSDRHGSPNYIPC